MHMLYVFPAPTILDNQVQSSLTVTSYVLGKNLHLLTSPSDNHSNDLVRGQAHPFRPTNSLQDNAHSSSHPQEPPLDSLMPYSPRRTTVYSLPVELLTRIFVLGAGYDYPYAGTPFLLKPDQDYYANPSSNFQLLVSRICRLWRQIALRTASLWSILHFREPAHIVRAQEYISRCSSPHLFDILVDTVAERDHIPGVTLCREEIQQIFKLICPQVKRWRAFHLKVCDHECKAAARQHLSTCGPAPNLETLQLYHFEDYLTSQNLYLATYRPPVMVFSNDLPRLKNISLIGVNLPWAQSPYLAHLHTLELALHPENIRPPYEYWESMLRNSPDLQTLSLHYSGPRVANGDTKLVWPTERERIIIQSLENLSLTDLDPDYLVRLMEHLILPGLKRLSLDLPDQDFTPFLELITGAKNRGQSSNNHSSSLCFSHLPFPFFSKLESLVLTALEASIDSLRNFVHGLKGLRTLEIHFASVSDAFVDILFEEMEVEVKDDSSNIPDVTLRTAPHKSCSNTSDTPCPGRAASTPLSVEHIPVLPLLETLKISGLSGAKTRELIHFRYTHFRRLSRREKREGVNVSDVSRWIVKWSERWKGKDKVLDQLVEQGWTGEDGTRVYLKTFEGEIDEEVDYDDVEGEGEEGEQAQNETADAEDEDEDGSDEEEGEQAQDEAADAEDDTDEDDTD